VARLEAISSERVFGVTMPQWVARQHLAIRQSVQSEMGVSLALKETVEEASKRLVKGMGMKRAAADVLSRTALLQSGADARDAVYEDHADLLTGFQYLATLDIRTCEICAPDDLKFGKTRAELPALLRHPRCRCTIIPVTPLSDRIPDRPAVTRTDSRTVHHRDGSTSTKFKTGASEVRAQGFTDFFERQPESWQREWLGAERFKLWRSGALTSIKELATNRRILTLPELKARLGVEDAA
jgi:hypothetical protein